MKEYDVDVLLVEDDVADRELILRALKKINLAHGIRIAKDGAEALSIINVDSFGDRGSCPKLVILDLKLPKVTGHEVLKVLKSDNRTMNIPVVVFSSSNHETDIDSCYQQAANSYIVKPVNFEQFEQAVQAIGTYWLEFNRTHCDC